jgi:rhomboid protease GluP
VEKPTQETPQHPLDSAPNYVPEDKQTPLKKITHPLEHTTEEEDDDEYMAQQKLPRLSLVVSVTHPYLTYGLVAVNLAIFGLTFFFSDLGRDIFNVFALDPERVWNNFELYRLFSPMFLHASVPHILFNMISLFTLGQRFEAIYGRERFLFVYFLGGLGGSVMSAAIGDYTIGSVGASGAIMAIYAADLWMWHNNQHIFGNYARTNVRNNLIFIGIFTVIGFLPGSIIDNWGHIGGLLFGLAVAYVLPVRIDYVPESVLPSSNSEIKYIADMSPFHWKKLPRLLVVVAGLLGLFLFGLVGFNMGLFA